MNRLLQIRFWLRVSWLWKKMYEKLLTEGSLSQNMKNISWTKITFFVENFVLYDISLRFYYNHPLKFFLLTFLPNRIIRIWTKCWWLPIFLRDQYWVLFVLNIHIPIILNPHAFYADDSQVFGNHLIEHNQLQSMFQWSQTSVLHRLHCEPWGAN